MRAMLLFVVAAGVLSFAAFHIGESPRNLAQMEFALTWTTRILGGLIAGVAAFGMLLAVAYALRSSAYKARGDRNKAAKDYAEAIRLDPKVADCDQTTRVDPKDFVSAINRSLASSRSMPWWPPRT